MSKGYDQFFKQARKVNHTQTNRLGNKPGNRAANKLEIKPVKNSGQRARFTLKTQPSTETKLKATLQSQNRARAHARRERAKVPWASFIFILVSAVVAAICYFSPATLEYVTAHVDIGAFGLAEAKEDTKTDAKSEKAQPNAADKNQAGKSAAEKPAATDAKDEAKTSQTAASAKAGGAPDIRNWTPEELKFFNKLSERKHELDQREAELNKLDEELQKQRSELDAKLKHLEKVREEIAGVLKNRVTADQEKVDKLVQFYSGMKPPQAAKVIETLNEDLAVAVLDKLKKKSAAEILDAMDAKKAQKLSEMLAGYRQTASED